MTNALKALGWLAFLGALGWHVGRRIGAWLRLQRWYWRTGRQLLHSDDRNGVVRVALSERMAEQLKHGRWSEPLRFRLEGYPGEEPTLWATNVLHALTVEEVDAILTDPREVPDA